MEDKPFQSKDDLTEILIYLPVKSLLRFKCISNHWFSLITSKTFVTMHLQRDGTEILLLKRSLPRTNGYEYLEDIIKSILSFHDPDSPDSLVLPDLCIPFLSSVMSHKNVSLFGPCNGLICLMHHDTIILCNPAMREFKLLVSSPFSCPEGYRRYILASGLGFDAKNDSYKILQMWYIDEETDDEYPYSVCVGIDLYNSSTNSWRHTDEVVPPFSSYRGLDFLFNGAFHWETGLYIDGPPTMGVMLSFDVSTEVFKQIEFPHEDRSNGLVVLNQCPTLVCYGNLEPEPIHIWVMKEYGVKESWTKELLIGPCDFRLPPVSLKYEWLVGENKSQLVLCALHASECKMFQFEAIDYSFRALVFTESLFSVNTVFCCSRN